MPRKILPLFLATLATLPAGCGPDRPAGPSAANPPTGTTSTSTSPAGSAASAGPADPCPPTANTPPVGEFEGVGGSADVSLWAMLFLRDTALNAGEQAKIVWRMTGSGAVTLRATGPGGAGVDPASGPTEHDGSTWDRPGTEWGTIWVFPAPGCWTVRADRTGGATGTLTLRVDG